MRTHVNMEPIPEDLNDTVVFHLSALVQPRFGEWIRSLRQSRGLSFNEVELESGVFASTWHRVENGMDARLSTAARILRWVICKGMPPR